MSLFQVERHLVQAIAWITITLGLAQIAASHLLLPSLGASGAPLPAHLLATVGLFMVIVSGTLLHAIKHTPALPVVIVWSIFQKIVAALFMAWGVQKGVFAPIALSIALFDFASGILFFDFRRRLSCGVKP